MTLERLWLSIAIASATAGVLLSWTWLLWFAAGAAGAFVVAWCHYELRPHDPWRKFKKRRADD